MTSFVRSRHDILSNAEVFGMDEGVDLIRQKTGKVRKDHTCFQCGGHINKGDDVIIGVAKIEGQLFTSYVCVECCDAVVYDELNPTNNETYMDRYRKHIQEGI